MRLSFVSLKFTRAWSAPHDPQAAHGALETHWDPLGPAASREQIHLQGMDVELKGLEGAHR